MEARYQLRHSPASVRRVTIVVNLGPGGKSTAMPGSGRVRLSGKPSPQPLKDEPMPSSIPHRTLPRPRSRIGAIVLLAVAVLLGGAPFGQAATRGEDGLPVTNDKGVRFVIVSHRGGALERPENSVEAYQHSVEQGFDVIETDLLFTRDGHGVMSHNDLLPARCTHAGEQLHLMTLDQVREVRCQDLDGEFTVPIPTFEEFAEVVKPSDVRIDLDIKTYSGQPASGERLYAERAIKLLKQHALLDRSSILTFRWATTLPTIRKLAPRIRVVGLDNKPMDLSRVRLAASLGADGFGIKAKDSPANLLKYVKAKGMDPVPWEITTRQFLAYSIYYGGKVQGISSDTPTEARALLLSGGINLNPKPASVVTTLPTAATVARKATYKAGKRKYPKVMGTAVPLEKLAMLETVTVKVKVTKGPGKGYVSLGASGSPVSSSVRVKLPKGTRTLTVKVPVGNGGKLRVFTSRTATLTLSVAGYTNLSFS